MYQGTIALCFLVFIPEKILVYHYFRTVHSVCTGCSIKVPQLYSHIFKLRIVLKEHIMLDDIRKTGITSLKTCAQPCKFAAPCLIEICEFFLFCIRDSTVPELIVQLLKSRVFRMFFPE